jgi:hypothetical protein
MGNGPYLVAGTPEDLARAWADDKPLSPELAATFDRRQQGEARRAALHN